MYISENHFFKEVKHQNNTLNSLKKTNIDGFSPQYE